MEASHESLETVLSVGSFAFCSVAMIISNKLVTCPTQQLNFGPRHGPRSILDRCFAWTRSYLSWGNLIPDWPHHCELFDNMLDFHSPSQLTSVGNSVSSWIRSYYRIVALSLS